jgi:hypothetical protein
MYVRWGQGGQIGRIFAYWAAVYCGQYFENCKRFDNFLPIYFLSTSYVLIFTKHGLGYILGNIFKNTSDQPGCG